MIKLLNRSERGPRTAPNPLAGRIVQLRMELRHVKPPIWRRLVVPGDIKLDRFHDVIQIAMGWTNSHLHAFRQGRNEYVIPDPDDPGWNKIPTHAKVHDERRHTLADLVATEGDLFQYDYDFGDGWEHDIRVEEITVATKRLAVARCLAGKRACPPEDCGGIGGYFDLLDALANPKKRKHRDLLEWLGPDFHPERFNLKETNELLREVSV